MKKLFYLTKGVLMLTTLGFLIMGCSNEPILDYQEANLKASVSKKSDQSNKYHFTASLKGSNEVSQNPVVTNAAGQAIVTISDDETKIHYKLIVANIENVIQSHFHIAPPGSNGGVVAFLFGPNPQPSGPANGILAEGDIEAANVIGGIAGDLGALIDAIRSGNVYVNVHTSAYPGGEIRGNLK